MTNCNHCIVIILQKILYKHHQITNNLLEENIFIKRVNKKIRRIKKHIKENKYMNNNSHNYHRNMS